MVSLTEETHTERMIPPGDSTQLNSNNWTLYIFVQQEQSLCYKSKSSFLFWQVCHSRELQLLCVFITVSLWILSSIKLILKQTTRTHHNQLAGLKPCKHKVLFPVTCQTFTEHKARVWLRLYNTGQHLWQSASFSVRTFICKQHVFLLKTEHHL